MRISSRSRASRSTPYPAGFSSRVENPEPSCE
ncbi:Protein of unknown function [Thermobacillus xylanilyticus]|uniref:Uncharacterized protein n=1 Tax=Thermobacillus xylanilyticus TaxID=76633 RepID=A0ABM8V6N7_THEXY|nr:Protein of unknown function [Thermobacillus xylanilyticus]